MTKIVTTLVLLLAAVSTIACSNGSPIGPSDKGNSGGGQPPLSIPPTPGQYPALPIMSRLKDADGKDTRMWIRVIQLNPLPGSRVLTDPSKINCLPPRSGNCMQLVIEMGMDPFLDRPIGAAFKVGFSHDGQTMSSLGSMGPPEIIGLSLAAGTSTTHEAYRGLDFLPKYILITGRHGDDSSGHVVWVDGKTTILLDYQPM